jgi:chorismate-pyruvate lyase
VIDGTVTTVLSAWALEPVAVQPLSQQSTVLPSAEAWLDAPAGTPVIERAVLLVGVHSQSLFAFAESVICTERLPAALRNGLSSGGLSLGQLLLLPGFESRREGLWYGRDRPLTLPPAVAALTEPDFLTRTYRVSAGSRPLMLITERFPWRLRE